MISKYYKQNINARAYKKVRTYKKFRAYRSSPPEVLLGKGVLKICSKFTGEYTCGSMISIKLQSNFIEITLQHGCSPVNLLNIFRTPFLEQLRRAPCEPITGQRFMLKKTP